MPGAPTDDLEFEIKQLIVASLNLEDIVPSDIDSTELLFGEEGLALDSIDALEIGIEIAKKYGVKIDPENDATRESFRCVRSIASLVARDRKS
jgi:acyl carrier protein